MSPVATPSLAFKLNARALSVEGKISSMAVPFSRPAYPRARRPREQPQQPQGHPITRFLEGRGGIRLDQLSFTSRVAFYALYEAYR